MLQKSKRKFGSVYLEDGSKICANPFCWEIVPPENRVYCSDECRIFMEKKKRKDLLSKYYKEYRLPGLKRYHLALSMHFLSLPVEIEEEE